MPIEQLCNVVEMTPLNDSTYWMTLEVGKMVEEQGLRARTVSPRGLRRGPAPSPPHFRGLCRA